MNPTKKELILKKGTIIGDSCGVAAVILFPMKLEYHSAGIARGPGGQHFDQKDHGI